MRLARFCLARFCLARFILLAGFLLLPAVTFAQQTDRPIPVIFDTDIGNDIDDVVALAMLHALQTRGECRLIAVTISKDHDLAGPFADAVNTFYGRGDIRIGVVHDGPTRYVGKYLPLVDSYPHRLKHGKDAPDAVALLRETLTKADDASVVIIQTGFSTNLARLLDSSDDGKSKLSGRDLVAKKVKYLSIMAGNFTPHGNPEYNVTNDIASAKKVFETWPTPVVFSGAEVGGVVTYPSISILQDYRYVQHHPLAEGYTLYNPPPHNRPCWDPTAVLYAIRPNRNYFSVTGPGRVTVTKDGATLFTPAADGNRRCLQIDHDQIVRTTEAIVELASQPPK
jgi:inosine-uridine nucleoside N-ribohydrolase